MPQPQKERVERENVPNTIDSSLLKGFLARGLTPRWEVKGKRLPYRLFRFGRSEFMPWEYWPEVETESAMSADVAIGGELAGVRSQIDDLASDIETVKMELSSCKHSINKLYEELSERPLIKETSLFEIDEKLEVLQPIPITIEETKDEVMAAFPEVEAFAIGVCEAEAINNLKSGIAELYYEIIETPEEELGRLPRRWRKVLEKVIRKVGST